MSEITEKLQAPFPPDVIETYKVAGKDVPFAGARAYMDRLDEVFGHGMWSTRYVVVDKDTCAVECSLAVFDGELHQWVTKTDIGYPNDAKDAADAKAEPLKAAYSDAFKRACVQWGVGRFLYNYTPGQPKPQEPKPPVADSAKTKQDIKQMGSFAMPDGKFNVGGWAAAMAPIRDEIASVTGGDVKAWLKANPSKSLDDLIAAATESEAVSA